MKKTISTKQTRSNIDKVLNHLAETPAELGRLRGGLTEEQLQDPPSPGERSFHQTVSHLLRSNARFPETIYLANLASKLSKPIA